MHNATRWDSKYRIFRRYCRMKEDFVKVIEHEGAEIRVSSSAEFMLMTDRYQ